MSDAPLSHAAMAALRTAIEWPDLDHERYTVKDLVGKGGMGAVFRAYDAVLARDVALKVMSSAATAHGVPERLRDEQRTIARLEHPAIVPVYDAGTTRDGRGFYVMRLVNGRTLEAMLARPIAEFSADARLRVFERVCEAVAFAHAEGVVHCDLKPSNVMIGAFGEVFVMDWGLATFHDGTVEKRAGTPGFMAPEQSTPGAAIDARTDVFALGAMLRVLAVVPRGASPRALAAIIGRAQARNPGDRYPSVTAMLDDVRRLENGIPTDAYRESLWERVVRVGRKYEVAVVLLLVYVVVRGIMIITIRR